MRIRRLSILLPASIIILAACTSEAQDKKSQPEKTVGGCACDTLPLGIEGRASCEGAAFPVRVSILSVEDAGIETYRSAAEGLLSLLDSLQVPCCGGADLAVMSRGPCWPRYRVDIRMAGGSESALPAIRSALEGRRLAGLSPSGDRPDDYGLFFVQAGFGSSDVWTLWYTAP